MPRHARLVIPGLPHHITQRGNNRQQVFFDEEDYLAFLFMLREHALELKVVIDGYCLMPNHYHVDVIPPTENSLALLFGKTQQDYTVRLKARRNISGHLWQARFHSSPMDEEYQFNALCYIERNPERARIVRYPWEYPWSSAHAHVTGHDPYRILDMPGWMDRYPPEIWRELLSQPIDMREIEYIRKQTFAGQLMRLKR